MKNKLLFLLLLAVLVSANAACAQNKEASPVVSDKYTLTDRMGNFIEVPANIERIVSVSPANTEVLAALGVGGKIIAADKYSEGIETVPQGIPLLDMLSLDAELLVSLQPDIVFATGMSMVDGEDPYKLVKDAGICVAYVPASASIAAIKEDILFIAQIVGLPSDGQLIVDRMQAEIDAVKAVGDMIADKKTVFFEISAAPYIYSFGTGVFLHEMIELIGATNVISDRESWTSISEEVVLSLNPDVILTTTNYLEDPVGEIMSRSGWNVISAVKNGEVYYINTNSSNRSNHNIVKALKEMAKAVYPDKY